MDAYVYQAALICDECAKVVMRERMDDPDSHNYPQGPYGDGGGESDVPQHCDHCGVFLENPLTTAGEEYVREHVSEGGSDVLDTWRSHYDYLFDEDDEEPVNVPDDYFDAFLDGYVKCALWSSHDDDEHAMDENYDRRDIHSESMQFMRESCLSFLQEPGVYDMLCEVGSTAERAGHDFWLTRNYHGAGFWDRGYGKIGDQLTERAQSYCNVELIIGEDGLVHVC